MPTVKAHASAILAEYERALTELFGKTVILTNGIAGTVENLWLDDAMSALAKYASFPGLNTPGRSF